MKNINFFAFDNFRKSIKIIIVRMALILSLSLIPTTLPEPAIAEEIRIGDWVYSDGYRCQIQYRGWMESLTIQAYHFSSLEGPSRYYEIYFKPAFGFFGRPSTDFVTKILVRNGSLERHFYYSGTDTISDEFGSHRIVNAEQSEHFSYMWRPRELTSRDMDDFLFVLSGESSTNIFDSSGVLIQFDARGTREAILSFKKCRQDRGL